ncbi:MAG TPA: hypothetical protein VNM46_05165 [Xanthobacteraceae bacterium]|jgi:hypothetical protein|nr:hypothetical protein [Xanthobacteraceae bacterium]
MFASLFGLVQADIDRQVDWAKEEARRRVRYVVRVAILAGIGAFALVGATAIGLIALHTWLAAQWTPMMAHAIVGGGLIVFALIFFLAALAGRPPKLATRPPLQFAKPAVALGALASGTGIGAASRSAQEGLKFASDTVQQGSRSSLLGTLALAAVVGFIISRKR